MNEYVLDFHMHSLASDGTFSPEEVVMYAKEKGLKCIALTDHDTVYGLEEAMHAAEREGIKLIQGIEIDAKYSDGEIEVDNLELLGLNIDKDKMQAFTKMRAEQKMNLMKEYIDNYNKYITSEDFEEQNKNKEFQITNAYQFTIDDLIKWNNSKMLDSKGVAYENPEPMISKMTFVRYIAENQCDHELADQILKGFREAGGLFKKEYKSILTGNKDTKPTFVQAIQAVHDAGGKAVLAHAGLDKAYVDGMTKGWEDESANFTTYHFIEHLVNAGLDGIELYNYEHSAGKSAEEQKMINDYMERLANHFGLFVTYGSDCHGAKGKGPLMGTFGATEEQAEEVLKNF